MVTLYPTSAVTSIVMRVVSGWAIDHLPTRYLFSAALFLQSMVMFVMGFVPPPMTSPHLVVVLQSMGNAINMNVGNVAFANYFGRAHLGEIQTTCVVEASCRGVNSSWLEMTLIGARNDTIRLYLTLSDSIRPLGEIQTYSSAMIVAGSALGPFPFGVVSDVTGSFGPAFRWFSILPLLSAAIVIKFGVAPKLPAVRRHEYTPASTGEADADDEDKGADGGAGAGGDDDGDGSSSGARAGKGYPPSPRTRALFKSREVSQPRD